MEKNKKKGRFYGEKKGFFDPSVIGFVFASSESARQYQKDKTISLNPIGNRFRDVSEGICSAVFVNCAEKIALASAKRWEKKKKIRVNCRILAESSVRK